MMLYYISFTSNPLILITLKACWLCKLLLLCVFWKNLVWASPLTSSFYVFSLHPPKFLFHQPLPILLPSHATHPLNIRIAFIVPVHCHFYIPYPSITTTLIMQTFRAFAFAFFLTFLFTTNSLTLQTQSTPIPCNKDPYKELNLIPKLSFSLMQNRKLKTLSTQNGKHWTLQLHQIDHELCAK